MSDYAKAKGRTDERFVQLPEYLLASPAYRSLSTAARALLVEFRRRFNGRNNGRICFSVREMARDLGVWPDTAINAHRELQARGFVKITLQSTFDTRKDGQASEWLLTSESLDDKSATKEFMRWRSDADDLPIRDGSSSRQKRLKRKKQWEK